MRTLFPPICGAVLALWPLFSSAAVISRDWQTPGDGLLTFDTVNKREWLDLSQTLLTDHFPGADPNPTIARELRYQYVVSQTAEGGLFSEFTVGKSIDVMNLAKSAGIDISTQEYDQNYLSASLLGYLLSFTVESTSGNKLAIGLLDELSAVDPFRLGATIYVDPVSGTDGFAGLRLSTEYTQFRSSPPGVFLYRAVPEPRAIVLLSLGFAGLLLRPRIKKQTAISTAR